MTRITHCIVLTGLLTAIVNSAAAQDRRNAASFVRDTDLEYPPTFPNGSRIVSGSSPEFLTAPEGVPDDVLIAETPPQVDLIFYPNQNYPGKPWSNWGDGCTANGKYYSAIGDHFALGRGEAKHGTGTAFVYEFDPKTRTLRSLVDVTGILNLPAGHYTPGKIHSRIDMGSDGWLYYATHRGSTRVTTDANHYQGDWILRTNPVTGTSEVVAHGPVPKHCIPNSVVDPQRMIFYGGTAPGSDADSQDIQFFAFDLKKRKLIYSGPNGPARYMILAQSTGCVYFVPGNSDGELMKFDPQTGGPPTSIGKAIGVRAATHETEDGLVYSVSKGQRSEAAALWQFNAKNESVRQIGSVGIGDQAYVASIDISPDGRYLYYVPGAHGGAFRVGSPVVQFDVKTQRQKVITFLHPWFQNEFGMTLKGTYSTALSEEGDKLFITWNVSRGTKAWDCCALAVVQIPASERAP